MITVVKLKELRTKHNLSVNEFAKIISVSPSTVRSWENGKTKPTLLHLIAIADYFQVRLNFLVGRE